VQITDLKFTTDALTRGPYLTGLTGAQLYVSIDHDIVVNTAIGHASEGRAMTPETILPWCCCSKLPTVLAAARIFADTGTALDSRVQDIVPEYGQAGKQDVTFEQLLSHTVPYRTWGTQPSMDDVRALRGMQAADALARVCSEPLSAPPGTEAVYTAIAS
jgi:CubicO group peptidase (beta-lactamase class C family)